MPPRSMIGILTLLAVMTVLWVDVSARVATAQESIRTKFTGNETVDDGTVAYPGEKFHKRWECRVESGTVHNVYIVQVPIQHGKGQAGLKGGEKPILLKTTATPTKAGGTFWMEVEVTVPANLKPGIYEADYRISDAKGKPFDTSKPPVFILLDVRAGKRPK